MKEEVIKETVNDLVKDEGFSEKPYIDPLVERYPEKYGVSKRDMEIIKRHFEKLKVTIGFGFTYITKSEAIRVLEEKVEIIYDSLSVHIDFFKDLPPKVQSALCNMAYQLGVEGLLKFKKTLSYLKEEKYGYAYREMLNSAWYRQTPTRAIRVAGKVRELAYDRSEDV